MSDQFTRTYQLVAEIRDLTAMRSTQAPGSPAWAALGRRLAALSAEWLAWQGTDGPKLASIEARLCDAQAREARARRAVSPWPWVAVVTGSLGLLLAADWYLFGVPWMPTAIAALAIATAGAVLLTAAHRRRIAAELGAAIDARRGHQADKRQLVSRYTATTRVPVYATAGDE